jgi:hypothetical protein
MAGRVCANCSRVEVVVHSGRHGGQLHVEKITHVR